MKILAENMLEKVNKELEALLSLHNFSSEVEIVLFGKSIATERLVEWFEEKNISILGFVDNDKARYRI